MKRGEHRSIRGDFRRKQKLPVGKFVIILLNLILIGGIGYGIFTVFISSKFQVTNVVVNGTEFIPPQDILDNVDATIAQEKFLWIPTKNIYLISKQNIREGLAKEYVFKNLFIESILPNTIVVTIEEKDIAYTLMTNSFEYLIDTHGEVVRKLPTFRSRPSILSLLPQQEQPTIDSVSTFDKNSSFPIIHLTTETELNMSQNVLDASTLVFIGEIIASHQAKNIDIFAIKIDQPNPQHITISTTKNYDILVNTHTAFSDQIQKLKVVLSQEIKDNEKRLEYIDMRLGNNIYYKYK